MPFEQSFPRPFTATSVRNYAPMMSGVYGISNARRWIYIDVTDNIQDTLLAHLQDPLRTIMKEEPTGFVFEICDSARRASRQDRLVLEYEPALNRNGPRR